MYAKKIPYKTFKEAVSVAFNGDDKIFSLYDPTKSVKTKEEIVEDIYNKVREYDQFDLHLKGVYEKNELIGYYVSKGILLVSFSLNVKYRTRHYLKEFYSIIKKEMKSKIMCFLFSKNVRAIKWLQKNGMEVVNSNNLITQLVCP